MKKVSDKDEKVKRFYTVKEAAKVLGVSTNTVYKYLAEGNLKATRLENRGRFKIPFSELAPYLSVEESAQVGRRFTVSELVLGILLGMVFFSLFSQPSLMADIAGAVWGYPGRTFSGFGALVQAGKPKLMALTSKFVLSKTPADISTESPKEKPKEKAELVLIKVPSGSNINVREEATTSSKILAKIKTSEPASKVAEEDDWTKVAIRNFPVGWVYNQFIGTQEEANSFVLSVTVEFKGQEVVISETPTDWLRVRDAPGGEEIGKVYPGESYVVLDEIDEWLLIEISEGQKGWISSEFAQAQSVD